MPISQCASSAAAEAHGRAWRERVLKKGAGFDGGHQGGDQQDEGLLMGRQPRLALQQGSQGDPQRGWFCLGVVPVRGASDGAMQPEWVHQRCGRSRCARCGWHAGPAGSALRSLMGIESADDRIKESLVEVR